MSRAQATDGFNPKPGVPEQITPMVRRILAPNPSPMTYRGTNSYLIGTRDIAVIDPGPASSSHLAALLAALEPGQRISHILVTHSHLDHSPLAAALQAETGAPILAFGDFRAGRSAIMEELVTQGVADGGEGMDREFACDRCLKDGEVVSAEGWSLEALHTPGHIGNHLCFALGDTLFSGDHVMGWASSLVSPPDGDLTDFMASCRRLQHRRWTRFLPGHGDQVSEPAARLDWLIEHRLSRETAILDHLRRASANAAELTQLIYTETPSALLLAAERNVFAHLVDLHQRGKAQALGPLTTQVRFAADI
ncbi:MBL fold metallo-hydrolase [Phaeobacter sp. HF9A]|uniref:MBL fold metallo-hydrolase n=1 Tax=Phaeobacter sp. HF9A TaxID=2721561 RepID=UPI00142FFCBD|nr:MBL fold metallo-hydrolase [Phaeobacter sp. HF9A]NIZ12419.1 MBL fold metallo-hydrolase [Phaeobacter sp. HF9A]